MPDALAPVDLPRRGPFVVQGKFVSASIAKAILLALLGVGAGGGALVYAALNARNVRETARIWQGGVEAADGSLDGKWSENHGVRSYDLTLDYTTQEGASHRRKVKFTRFFGGPGEKDPYSVRYLPSEPNLATISWAYEARVHHWIWTSLAAGIGLLMLIGLLTASVGQVLHLRLVQRLAAAGELIRGEVLNVKTTLEPRSNTVKYTYSYRFERNGTLGGKYTGTEKQEPMLLENGKALVLLASPHSRDHAVIEHSGYPLNLAAPPPMPGIMPSP